ncbi:two-component sensor histidine kinase [Taibaiella sp. KBW10]|uniref:sensor histidine kinase n=1 Tax=Taibaiella sp. KBW10 TaxID=2153357 RepID=UPI000F5917AF|nr:ATP-binding protein [Taibaiella sp. KBW10]RQO29677.1 two-component sensor histidine kinase [Taibaiella sp. KBW10]
MQIKTRLTLLFTALVATLLLAFALTVYFSSSETREEEYFKRLRQQAATKANLLFDTKITPNVLQLIYKNAPNALFQEEVAIYDTAFHLLYHDAVEIDKVKETMGMIDSIIARKEIQFYIGEIQVVGFLYEHDGGHYVITAASKDEYGLTKLADLRYTIIIALLVAVIIIFLAGQFLAKKSLQPVSTLVGKVQKITATNLDLRVDEGDRKDEIAALAITFNEMLNRLEHSFDAQKRFVSNISHELRTPLTAMLAELQLTAEKKRDTEEYQAVIAHTITDTQKLIRLSNSLLDLAKANYDETEISFKNIRLDELLLDARMDVLHNQPHYKVNITFEQEIDHDKDISVHGNEYLLKVAFINLMENGCKFSEDLQSTVFISYDRENILLRFADKGVGISAEELPYIFTPFYRGANKKFADGNGIGLSLTQKIVELHKGHISVVSKEKEGTTFTITLPHN